LCVKHKSSVEEKKEIEQMGTGKTKPKDKKPGWITGWLPTTAGVFPVIATRLTSEDVIGGWRVRWGIRRMDYRINPGLYAVGKPDTSSPILVTANYKLTFDSLRKHIGNISAWVLVLDTKGVNVWCAAGKGTFGTEELIRRIKSVNLSSLLKNRTIILPQLGAPGVAAHIVTAQTGFKVIYGPIRSADLPKFLANGLKTDSAMRNVTFTLKERLAVVPVELVQSWKMVLAALVYFLILRLISGNLLAWSTVGGFLPYLAAVVIGCAVVPALLPFVPGKSFAFKGWLAGILATFVFTWLSVRGAVDAIAYLLILPAISAYLALNFTGCSTYTSLSGVKREMKIALPLLIFSAVFGVGLQLYSAWRT
jgi:hypothetical protein